MRISDWSSDVCSSDLHGRRRRRKGHVGFFGAPAREAEPVGAKGLPGLERVSHAQPGEVVCDGALCHAAMQIGRASCRERVCQVRVDLGGRRIIKKKKTICNNTEKNIYNDQ